MAQSSASPCLVTLPPCGKPALVHSVVRPGPQPLLALFHEDVLSMRKSTFGTCAGMFGLVVKRSVSSPTRPTPAAITEPQLARSTAKKILSRRLWSVFILFLPYLLVLFAVSSRQAHLQALVNLACSAGLRIAGGHRNIPVGVLGGDARQRAVARSRLEKEALRPINLDVIGPRCRRCGSAGRQIRCPHAAVGDGLLVISERGCRRGQPSGCLLAIIVEERELSDRYFR